MGISRVRPKIQRGGWLRVSIGGILGRIPFERQDGMWVIYGFRICGDDQRSAMPDTINDCVITADS